MAILLVRSYVFKLKETTFLSAVKNEFLDFLYVLWSRELNYIDKSVITMNELFIRIRESKLVLDKPVAKSESERLVREIVMSWQLRNPNDNTLMALIVNRFDHIALEVLEFYHFEINKSLLIFLLETENKNFLKHALLLKAFDKAIFNVPDVAHTFQALMNDGARSNFLLDVLTLIDLSGWKNKWLKSILDVFNNYCVDNYQKNQLLLSHNPLQTIVLSCELINKIQRWRRKFENDGERI